MSALNDPENIQLEPVTPETDAHKDPTWRGLLGLDEE